MVDLTEGDVRQRGLSTATEPAQREQHAVVTYRLEQLLNCPAIRGGL